MPDNLDVEVLMSKAVAEVRDNARRTGSTYTHVSLSIQIVERAIREIESLRSRLRTQPHVKSPATLAELDAILNSNDDRPIKINPDGSISPL